MIKMARTIINYIRNEITGNNAIMNEVTLVNINRICYAAIVAACIHLAHVLLFVFSTPGLTEKAIKWKLGIIYSHSSMMALTIVIGIMAFFLRKKQSGNRLMIAIQLTSISAFLSLGVVLTVIDQWVTTGITAFLTCTLGISLVFLIRPYWSALIFLGIYLLFYLTAAWTQPNPEMLLSIRVQGLSAVALSFVLSFMLWRTNFKNIKQKSLIETQNRELIAKNERLTFLAAYDSLTGLCNRRQFQEMVNQEIGRIRRYEKEACIILLDLDFFKKVNDNHGHPVGDLLLKQVATVLAKRVRSTDTVARLGGEEFMILLPETSLSQAELVGEKLKQSIQNMRFVVNENEICITASLGIAPLLSKEGIDIYSVSYKLADDALYVAKQNGRNRVVLAKLPEC